MNMYNGAITLLGITAVFVAGVRAHKKESPGVFLCGLLLCIAVVMAIHTNQ